MRLTRKIILCGREVEVEFDFDRGESQWFDARAGVGSPGYGPSVEILAFRTAGEYTSLANIEDQIFDILAAEEAERGCDAPEEL